MEPLLYLAPDVLPIFTDQGAVLDAPDGFLLTDRPTLRAVLRLLARSPLPRRALAEALGSEAVGASGAEGGGEPEAIRPVDLDAALGELLAIGAIVELPAPLAPGSATLWSNLGVSPADAARTLRGTAVEVAALDGDAEALAVSLREWGFSVVSAETDRPSPHPVGDPAVRPEAGPASAIRVVLAADPLDDRLVDVNAQALKDGTPWFLAVPTSAGAWIALFRPGHSACRECLAARLRYNRPGRALAVRKRGGSPADPPGGPVRPLPSSVASRLAVGLAAFAGRGDTADFEGHWSLFPSGPGGTPERHPLDRLPHCPACSDGHAGGVPDAHPLRVPPHETVRIDHRRQIDAVTGIAHSLSVTPVIGGSYLAVVRCRASGQAGSLSELLLNERHVAGGKGWSPDTTARAAVGEAAEHLSGVHRPSLRVLRTTASELGGAAILPREVDLFSDAQRARPTAESELSTLTVPGELDPHRVTEWVRAWPLTGGFRVESDGQLRSAEGPRWYPAGAAFYGYPFGRDREPDGGTGRRYGLATSNGCAAGPTYVDAVVSALLELIERDGTAVWWYNRLPRPEIDLTALADPRPARVREELEARGRTLWALAVTNDVAVPTVVAVSRRKGSRPGDRQGGSPGWVLGFGSALSYTEAAVRAVGELAQLLPATDDPNHPNPVPWTDTALPEDNPYLEPHGVVGRGELLEAEERRAAVLDAAEDAAGPAGAVLGHLLDRLHAVGVRAYVIDQTHPLVGVPVVRVLAPGLVHFWRRLGAPRLYDVPVRMGWRAAPMAEPEANPLDLTI